MRRARSSTAWSAAEFDVSELSGSEFISMTGRGTARLSRCPCFRPAFFRHGFIFINKRAGIARRKISRQARRRAALHADGGDLDSRPAGASVWRDTSTIRGCREVSRKPGTPRTSPTAAAAETREDRGERKWLIRSASLLAKGEIDALIGSRRRRNMGTHPDVVRLFPDYRDSNANSTSEPGSFRSCTLSRSAEVYEKYPWIADSSI